MSTIITKILTMKWNFFLGLKQLITGKKKFPKNVVVTAAHGSSKIPWSVFPYLQTHYQISPRLLLNFSDYGTKHLIAQVPSSQRVVAKYGRIIGDPNRARDSEEIVRFKDFGGMKIFREKFEKRLTKSWFRRFWLKKLLNLSYWPFYKDTFKSIEEAVKNSEDTAKPIILIDVHDTGNRILGKTMRQDRQRKKGRMPKIVISNAPDERTGEEQFGTAPEFFLSAFKNKLSQKLGLDEDEIQLNDPYTGGHVVRFFGNPFSNRRLRRVLKGRKIFAIQLEFDRAMYLNEVTQRPIWWKVHSVRNSFVSVIEEMEGVEFSGEDESVENEE